MKTIIVPLDFSQESLTGMNLSLMMANKTGSNINMVHVIGKGDGTHPDQLAAEHQQIKMKFEELLQKYREKSNSGFDISYTIREGKIFEEITSFAHECDDALTVLSTHGASGFEELFIGGNAYKVTSHSKIPVITVRRSKIATNFDKIVLPLDITFETREKVPYTVKLAQLFNSEIHLLTVQLSTYKNIEKKLHQYANQVTTYLNTHNIPYTVEHIQGDNLTDMTLDYSRIIDADLISIMTEQEKSLSNLLLGSYAHQMINQAYIPVLSFPIYQLTHVEENFRTQGIKNN